MTLEATDRRPVSGRQPGVDNRTTWGPIGLAAVLLVGVVLGAVLTFVVQDRGGAGEPAATPDAAAGTGAAGDPAEPGAGIAGPPTQQVLLAWSIDPLRSELSSSLAEAEEIERFTAVGHGTVGLIPSPSLSPPDEGAVGETVASPGPVVPIDAVAVDPSGYSAFVPPELASVFAGLRGREVVLGRTAAGLRGADVGDQIQLVNLEVTVPLVLDLTVVAVVDDAVIGGAELAVNQDSGFELALWQARYVLIAHHGDRAAIEERVRGAVPGPMRFRGPGETPFLRDGDAVLPQALIKERFGEFTVSWSGSGAGPVQDPGWADDHLAEIDLPVLGRVRCHRGVIDDLRAAMEQIEREHLDYLIDPTPSSRACWYPDIIDRTGMLSRGYWGIAVVLNSVKNPTGSSSVQDPRIVAIMQEHGFTWGGDFLVPEPSYFEHVGSATAPVDPPDPPG